MHTLIEKCTGATTPPSYTGTRAVPESAIKDLQCNTILSEKITVSLFGS